MKKILLIFTVLMGLFVLSCREDGEWNTTEGQFGLTIDRDDSFIEKAVGETNQLKFNIIPSYDFSAITTTFQYTTSLNGVLKLDGQVLQPNTSYTFTEKDNIFEYIGNVSGTHNLNITVKNSKGAVKEESFSLPYGVSEFSHTYAGGTATIYQGDETNYLMKVTPGSGQPTTGYQIRFDTYNGTVKLNGVPATLNTWYPINNIDSFNTSLISNIAGQGKLTYTIKNTTVSKDYEIQQNITAREITIESMQPSSLAVLPNTQMSLIGVVKKAPVTNNNSVQYKTWISSASNNNMNGIQTTNNSYTPYALGANGNFNINFNAVSIGNYTLNIQFKDEYGNESDIKTFNIAVEDYITFEGTQSAQLLFGSTSNALLILQGFNRTLSIKAGGGQSITNVEYTVSFKQTTNTGAINLFSQVYSESFTTTSSVLDVTGLFSTNTTINNMIASPVNTYIDRNIKVKATTSGGHTKEINIQPTATF